MKKEVKNSDFSTSSSQWIESAMKNSPKFVEFVKNEQQFNEHNKSKDKSNQSLKYRENEQILINNFLYSLSNNELLVFAAKSIGLVVLNETDSGLNIAVPISKDEFIIELWNPLKNYANTYELQVKLELMVSVKKLDVASVINWGEPNSKDFGVLCNDDPLEAAAYSTVLAAAYIGFLKE